MMKMKALVAAVALVGAGSASAAIGEFTSGNGELFLAVYDGVAQTSYVKDLGISMDSFKANTADSRTNLSFDLSSDANWNAFLGQTTMANLKWVVAAGDNTGGQGAGAQRYLSTSKDSLTTVKTQSNSQLTGFTLADNFVRASNFIGTNPTQANGSAVAVSTGATDYAYFGNGMGEKWNNKSVFNATAAVGQSQNFFYLTPSSTSGLAKATVAQYTFADNTTAATWTLGANNQLTYTAVAAVPEPGTMAMFIAGLLGVGAIARRRMSV